MILIQFLFHSRTMYWNINMPTSTQICSLFNVLSYNEEKMCLFFVNFFCEKHINESKWLEIEMKVKRKTSKHFQLKLLELVRFINQLQLYIDYSFSSIIKSIKWSPFNGLSIEMPRMKFLHWKFPQWQNVKFEEWNLKGLKRDTWLDKNVFRIESIKYTIESTEHYLEHN